MENYALFKERINSFEIPVFKLDDKHFSPNPKIKDKFDENNRFRQFYGDTTVFDLPDDVKDRLNLMVDALYKKAGECFAERIKTSTFHITLHDLSNSCDLSEISEEVFRNELKLLKFVHSQKISKCTIVFETNYVINMVGNSLVLALKPKTKEDYDKLMNLYSIVDCVKALPYSLTPHITLAYFNVNGFNAESAKNLCEIVNELNKEKFDITVSSDTLYYEKFTDMNSYHKIFTFTK